MSHVEISLIRIDGGTQSRAELNEAVVAEYAEAIESGAKFPPVSLFFDGNTYWLADGFHRYFAAKKAGLVEVEAAVAEGGRRDAVLHSLGANTNHGLRRSNADKRKAVETLLADSEWALMSDREAAKVCGVSHTFVAAIRSSLATVASEDDKQRTYTTKHGTKATMDTARIGKREVESDSTPPPPALPIAANEDDDDFGPSEEELAAAEQEIQRTHDAVAKMLASDDPAGVAAKEIERLNHYIRGLESQRNGFQNEAAEWKRKYLKLKREMDRMAA